jgi:hypothetical protein
MNPTELAEAIRNACLQAAFKAYDDAGVQGLCEAGRWEAAVGAIESLNLPHLLETLRDTDNASSPFHKRAP